MLGALVFVCGLMKLLAKICGLLIQSPNLQVPGHSHQLHLDWRVGGYIHTGILVWSRNALSQQSSVPIYYSLVYAVLPVQWDLSGWSSATTGKNRADELRLFRAQDQIRATQRVKNSTCTVLMLHSWYLLMLQISSANCAALFTNTDSSYSSQPEQRHTTAGHRRFWSQK